MISLFNTFPKAFRGSSSQKCHSLGIL
jgi:hypothetical protein